MTTRNIKKTVGNNYIRNYASKVKITTDSGSDGSAGTFKKASFSGRKVLFNNVSADDDFNINGTTCTIKNKTLK